MVYKLTIVLINTGETMSPPKIIIIAFLLCQIYVH